MDSIRIAHFKKIKEIQNILKNQDAHCVLKRNWMSNTLRNGSYKKGKCEIDLLSFHQVIELNPDEQWIFVEPRITFEKLCQFTLKYKLLPPVVPEFKSITLGGAIMGTALESSSHKWGQVNDNALEYELLLGNGELVTASPSENTDLFFSIPGSYGTLALLTAVKLRLIPSKKYVKIHLNKWDKLSDTVYHLTQPTDSDFLEGIIYSAHESFQLNGYLTDHQPASLCKLNHGWSPWYIQLIQNSKSKEIDLSIEDYLFRFDRGAFWMGRYIHSFWKMVQLICHFGIPKIEKRSLYPHFLFRFLFGWAFSSKKLYKIWHRVPNAVTETLFFIHDFYTPFEKASDALHNLIQQTQIFPVWLCPVKGTMQPQILSPHYGKKNFLNIGLYGIPESSFSIPKLTSQLELDILKFGGKKMLYSFSYYSREIFSEIYQMDRYEQLRKKYHAEKRFPDLFTKVTEKPKIDLLRD